MIRRLCGIMRRMLLQGEQFHWLKEELYRRKQVEYQKTLEGREKERDAALHENIVENLSRSATGPWPISAKMSRNTATTAFCEPLASREAAAGGSLHVMAHSRSHPRRIPRTLRGLCEPRARATRRPRGGEDAQRYPAGPAARRRRAAVSRRAPRASAGPRSTSAAADPTSRANTDPAHGR
jgi:hypothetical protein